LTCQDERLRKNPDLQKLFMRWCEVIEQASKADPLSRRFIMDTAPVEIKGAHLTVGVDPEFRSEMEQLDNPRVKLILGQAVTRVLGRSMSVSFRSLGPEERRPLPADHLVQSGAGEEERQISGLQKWYANPVVKRVIEAFNGEISDVRE
jgi:DNA polymerase III subunit gamma/tau